MAEKLVGEMRSRNIGELSDRAVHLVFESAGRVAFVALLLFFLPRIACTIVLIRLPSGPHQQIFRHALAYARPVFDAVYGPALMLLFANSNPKAQPIRALLVTTFQSALISAPIFATLAAISSLPLLTWFYAWLISSRLLETLPITNYFLLGTAIRLCYMMVAGTIGMTVAVFALVTVTIVSTEMVLPVDHVKTEESTEAIPSHDMIVPRPLLILRAALRIAFRRTFENGQWRRTVKIAVILAACDFLYGTADTIGYPIFRTLAGRLGPTVLSSALLVPAYALFAAIIFAYNQDARVKFEGLDINGRLTNLEEAG